MKGKHTCVVEWEGKGTGGLGKYLCQVSLSLPPSVSRNKTAKNWREERKKERKESSNMQLYYTARDGIWERGGGNRKSWLVALGQTRKGKDDRKEKHANATALVKRGGEN